MLNNKKDIAMGSMFNLLGIIMLVFGILQIILFFKIWGMTNDIRDMKNKYMADDYKRTIDSIEEIKKISKNEPQSATTATATTTAKVPVQQDQLAEKQIGKIDLENEDFKKLIDRWKILKKRGFIQQAIKEYTEKTSLPIEDAEKFINEL